MCGIAIAKYKNIKPAFERQLDRGTDSLGLITNSNVLRITGKYKHYLKWFKEQDKAINPDELVIFHHRAASVGAVNLDNSHPFKGEKFYLIQNGTSKKIFAEFKDSYKYSVDSRVILAILEDFCSTIEDIPNIIGFLLEDYSDIVGTLIVQDFTGKTLLYCDGERETDITIKDGYLESVYNYPVGETGGYKNKGYLFFNQSDGKILENNFEEINKELFYKKPVYTYVNPYDYSKYYNKPTTNTVNNIPNYSNLNQDEVSELSHIRTYVYDLQLNNSGYKINFEDFSNGYCLYYYGIDLEDFYNTFGFDLKKVLKYAHHYLIY